MKRHIIITVLFLMMSATIVHGNNPGEMNGVMSQGLDDPSWVYKGKGDSLYDEGRIGNAIVQYKKALIRRGLEQGRTGNGGYPEVSLRLARIYMDEGLYPMALEQIAYAKKNRGHFQIPEQYYDVLYLEAELLWTLKRRADALGVYEQIIIMDPLKNAYFNRDLSSIPVPVIEDMRQRQDLRKKYGKAYFSIGSIKYSAGHDVAAEPYLKMAFLYGYRREDTVKYLEEYYTMTNRASLITRLAR